MKKERGMTLSGMLTGMLKSAFEQALGTGHDLSGVTATATANPEFGDYQCNACMSLAGVMKKKPRDIAEAVAGKLSDQEGLGRVEVAGPGFINIFLEDDWLAARLEELGCDPRLGVPETGAGRSIVMDYGGPNITKPLHIGHLRSPNIGSSLDRTLRFLGYKVISDSHLGDWGTQFGITITGYRSFGDEQAMRENPMEELERVYVKSYEKSKQDEEWLATCRDELVKLQSGDEENLALWREFVELSKSEVDRVYGKLGFSFDLVRGESYYNDRLQEVVDLLVSKGIARRSEGALVAFLEEEGLPPAIVQKSDGGFNYTTSDIATVVSRLEEFGPDRVVYVHDERQQLHFKQVFAICRRLGMELEMQHVWFGLLRLPGATFSTREGNVIRLEGLLDEAQRRASELVREASPDMPADQQAEVARAVGMGAVKYADLGQNPQSLVTFTWEKAMALDGNSGPYLQYAYARMASVRDKYEERFPGKDPAACPIVPGEPIERQIAVLLARFPESVVRAAESCKPNVIADYAYELAQTYSTYYQNVPFLKAPEGTRESRVRLCSIVAAVLRKSLELLGIEAPERI